MKQLQTKRIKFGFMLLLIWCFISAFSRVYTGDAEQFINPIVLCFYTTLFSLIFFIACSYKQHKEIIQKIQTNKKEILGMNLATTGCWLFMFFPLKFLEPSIVGALTLCITPIATLMISAFIYRQQSITKNDYIISILAFSAALYLMIIVFFGYTAVQHISLMNNIFSIICCIIVSASLALSNIYAKKLNNNGFIPIEILSVRFVMLAIITGIITIFIKDGRGYDSIYLTINTTVITALTVIVIPQIAYQKAIRELQPITVAMVLPLMPVITYLIEFFDSRLNPTIYPIVGILGIFSITIISSAYRYYYEKSLILKQKR